MKSLKRAKVLTCLIVVFFAACAIIGFASAENYPVEEFQIYSNFFGINGICFMLLWVQVLYRLAKMNVEQVQNGNLGCFSSCQQLIETTLNNSDYYFQKCLCTILAITHCYSSISLIFVEQYVLYGAWIYYQYVNDIDFQIYDDNDEKRLKQEVYGEDDQFNAVIFMQVLSLSFGIYLQANILKNTLFKLFKQKQDEILYLNKDLPQGQEEEYQNNVVKYSFAYILLWIAILAVRLGVYIYISQNEVDELSYLAIYVFIQTIYFILYCFLILYKLYVIRNQIKNKQANVLAQNKELFQGWYTLVNSIMYSEVVNVFGAISLFLILAQSIFGLKVISTKQTIYTLNSNEYIGENILLADTIAITILLCQYFFNRILRSAFPNIEEKPKFYNFSIKETQIQPTRVNQNDYQPPNEKVL